MSKHKTLTDALNAMLSDGFTSTMTAIIGTNGEGGMQSDIESILRHYLIDDFGPVEMDVEAFDQHKHDSGSNRDEETSAGWTRWDLVETDHQGFLTGAVQVVYTFEPA